MQVALVSPQGLFLRSHYLKGNLPFDPKAQEWEKTTPLILPLSGQVIVQPILSEPSIQSLTVRSLHNDKEIMISLEWLDPSKNDTLTVKKFRDGAAVGFSLGNASPLACMGQSGNPMNIWHWKADWQADVDRGKARQEKESTGIPKPRHPILHGQRISSVEELVASGTSTFTSKQIQGLVQGNASWKDGRWIVVFKRALQPRDPKDSPIFALHGEQFLSFAVWDGDRGERGGQKAISSWITLKIDAG
ncbi:MAG: ethylbenzene dehydrogenase-related protein [Nitrospiraceae bacterium]